MGKKEVIEYLIEKIKEFESKLKALDSEISQLTKAREVFAKAYDSYRYTLETESREAAQMLDPAIQTNISLHNSAALPIHRAVEVVLKGAAQGMTAREIMQEITKRGKAVSGPNAVTIVSNSLKRFPDLFKKDGHKWTLIIKDGETRVA